MNLLLPLSLLFGVGIASLAMSLLAVARARAVARAAACEALVNRQEQDLALATMRQAIGDLAAQVQEIRLHPPAQTAAAVPRANLNLSKRSQALRLHRRGESPQKIAAALEIPRQEVDLLLKVHRIVISKV